MTNASRKPDLTPDDKNRIFQVLLANQKDGKFVKGKKDLLATSYAVSVRTINSIWRSAQENMSRDQAVVFKSNKKGKPGKKKVFLDEAHFRKILPRHKKSVSKLGKELGVSKSTMWLCKKDGTILPHTNAVEPIITEKNKIERMQFCLSNIYYDHATQTYKFHGMYNAIHIDEKFFYMKQEVERYYVLPDEVSELRTTQNKRFIQKIIFLCAVGRPHVTSPLHNEFDGKIGCWPLTKIRPTQRNSINKPRGTPELKAIQSINKTVTKEFMLEKVIPTIKLKCPASASKRILIQWDNAPPHISNDDPEIRAACSVDGFDIQLYFQPANSPNLNVNDLGWFRCLETFQRETRTYNVENLCQIVAESFEEVDHVKLNKVFLSLQLGMIEILKHEGCNGFKQPHMGKDVLIRLGLLPDSLEVDEALIRENVEPVIDAWDGEVPYYDLSELMVDLGYDDED